MKFTTIVAAVATALVAGTLVNSALQPARKKEEKQKQKRPQAKKKSISGQAACTIRRATFGGSQSALLRVQKDGVLHYIVMDLPTDNPVVSAQQVAWLDANYGTAEPSIVGVFSTVDAAVSTAANLCKRN